MESPVAALVTDSEERKDMKCLEESSLVPVERLVLITKTGWNSVILNAWPLYIPTSQSALRTVGFIFHR